MLSVTVLVAVLVMVARWGDAEPCHTCSHRGGGFNRFATASSLAKAGSFASSYSNSYANSYANSHANSHAKSHASSRASSSSSTYSRSPGGSFNFGHPTSCPGCGCGGCHGSCGWCGGSYGRRKRRSINNFLETPEFLEEYKRIAAEDKDQCGLRLVCELAQMDPRELSEDEVEILLPYSGSGESDGTVYGDYNEAAWHGQEGHQCHTWYPLCAFTANQIMEEYRNLKMGNPEKSQ